MKMARTRAEVFPAPQAWGWPWVDTCSLRKVIEALGGGSGGGLVARTWELWAPRSNKAERGDVSLWLSPCSAKPPWGPSSLSYSACRTPSGVSLWQSWGWDTGPAVMQTFQVHQVLTCSPPFQFPASLAPHLGLWG